MKKSFIFAVSALLLATGMLSATGQQDTSAGKDVTLSVLWFDDNNESQVLQNVMSDYLTAHPNIHLDMQVVPFKDYDQKLKMMIAGGTPPDLARVTTNEVVTFTSQLLPLNDKISNFDQVIKGFGKAPMGFATKANGDVVALPTTATANGMLVNVDAFTKAGIDIRKLSKTWNWDQWYDAMKKVVAANDKMDYALGLDFSPHRWSTLMYEAGGRFVNDAGTGMDFNTPEVLDALNFFKKLHDDKLAAPSVWMGSENPAELFKAGLVACHIGGSWNISDYASNIKDFQWAAVQMPKRKIRSSVVGGKFIAALQGAKNQQAALDFMVAFTDAKHNAAYCRDTFNLSGRTDIKVEYTSRAEDFTTMAADLAVTPAITAGDWKRPEISDIYSYIREQIVEGLLGNKTMAQVAQAIQDKGDAAFNKNK